MSKLKNVLTVFLILFLGLNLVPSIMAQKHIVSQAVLDDILRSAAHERENNLRKVGEFFSSARCSVVHERLNSLGLERITEAIPALSDAELSKLADQVEELDSKIAAGALTNEQLTYIVIALATAVIVLILVHD